MGGLLRADPKIDLVAAVLSIRLRTIGKMLTKTEEHIPYQEISTTSNKRRQVMQTAASTAAKPQAALPV